MGCSMTQYKLFEGEVAEVSTPQFHASRDRAAHLEQEAHRPRLMAAARLILEAQRILTHRAEVVDLGCGDGGLLSLIRSKVDAAWGYDFTPANAAGWPERQVKAELLDVFGKDAPLVRFGHIAVVTEVLEHLTDPHQAVKWIGANSRFIVASSPWPETPEDHDECHAWSFDDAGYRELIEQGGYQVIRHSRMGFFQLVLAERP